MEASRIPGQTDILSEMQTEYLPGTSGPVFGEEVQLCVDIVYRFWHDAGKNRSKRSLLGFAHS